MEPTVGFRNKFYQGEKGRFQFGVQTRTAYSGNADKTAGEPGIGPKTINNMVFTSFRYYLP